MMTTAKQMAETAMETPRRLRDELMDTGRRVWLAGLGALATAEEQAREMFEQLIDKGEQFEKREGKLTDMTIKPATERLMGAIEPAAKTIKDAGQAVEERLNKTVSGTLHRFGIPTHGEINALIDRVERLTKKVDGLQKSRS